MGDMNWIDMSKDENLKRAVVNEVMNPPVPLNAKNYLLS
jgi:hypothetical protein